MTHQIDSTDKTQTFAKAQIYFGNDEYPVIVKRFSSTEADIIINASDLDSFSAFLNDHSAVDFELAELAQVNTAEVVNIIKENDGHLVTLEFKENSSSDDITPWHRQSERKNLFGTGYIIVDTQYIECNVLNISATGAKIFLSHKLNLDANTEIIFKFDKMPVAGKANVRWSNQNIGTGTMMGLVFLEKFLATDK